MKSNLSGSIAFRLLDSVLCERFSSLLGVASRKSVFDWRESAVLDADVVVIDSTSPFSPLRGLPCIIWIGRERLDLDGYSLWVGKLPKDYTVSDLIDMLDRVAVFLLDWKARQPNSKSTQTIRTPKSAPVYADVSVNEFVVDHTLIPPIPPNVTVSALNNSRESRYRLTSWVFLEEPFKTVECTSALVLMTTQSATARQLSTHSGLSTPMLAQLLTELVSRECLQIISPTYEVVGNVMETKSEELIHKRILKRLAIWLKEAVSQ